MKSSVTKPATAVEQCQVKSRKKNVSTRDFVVAWTISKDKLFHVSVYFSINSKISKYPDNLTDMEILIS